MGPTGRIIGRVTLPASFAGLVWSADGKRLFAGGGFDDRIYRFDHAEGLLSKKTVFEYPNLKAFLAKPNPEEAQRAKVSQRVLAGLALTKDGKTLYAAAAFGHSLARFDAETGAFQGEISLGAAAIRTAWNPTEPEQLYVSLWSKARVARFVNTDTFQVVYTGAPRARRTARGARDRVGRPTLGRAVDRIARAERVPPPRAGDDRRIAVSSGRRPVRRHGVAAALAGRRCRRGSVDRPRGRWARQLPVVRSAARGAADRRAELTRDRRPVARDTRDAREDPRVIDWIVAQRIATFVAGTGSASEPTADLAALAAESEARVVAYTGLKPARPLPPPKGSAARSGCRATSNRCGCCSTRCCSAPPTTWAR